MPRILFEEATRDEVRHFRWAANRQRARMHAARTPEAAAECRGRAETYQARANAAQAALQKWGKRR